VSYSRRELYALGEPLGESVTERKNGHTLYGGGGGGGQQAPSQQTITQTSLPEYAREYVERNFGRAQAAAEQPYQTYSGQRIAGFDPLQQMAYQGAAQMGMPARAGQSLEDMYGFAQRAGNMQYDPSQYGNQFQAPRQYRPGQFGYDQVQNQQINAAQMGAAPQASAAQAGQTQLGASPQAQAAQAQAAQMGIAQLGAAPTVQGAQVQGPANVAAERVNAPQLRDLQMQAARDVGTRSFTDQGARQGYMDPYMQDVTAAQTREAQRTADIASSKRRGAMGQRGTYGSTAAALENAEANRNLATQLGDIQAQGLQAAYKSGMGQFNTEAQNRLQADLANQQAQQQANVQNLSAGLQTQGLGAQTGLTAQQLNQATGLQAGLANQQMGYNTGLQNAQLQQQANLANQALQGQYGLQQGQFGQQANQQNAQNQQQINLANQQAQNQIALANQGLAGQYGLQQGQFGQQTNLANQQALNQMALANQGLAGQYGLQQGQFNQQAAMQNPQLNMQAQLANQQARANSQQQAEASRQFGYGQQMQAAGMGAQYGQAANQLNEQSRQYGAGLGLQGLQAGMQGMGQYGNLGNQYNTQQQGIYNFQNQMGAQQQRLNQDILSQQYQDFLNQQRYPMQQVGFMSDILRGTPSNSSQTMYQAPPSMMSQLAGLGTAAYGASRLMGGAKGGQVKRVPSGLSALAISKIG